MKRLIYITILYFLCIKLCAQSPQAPSIKSPNVAGLGVFGDVPVGLFSGTPNIAVPLYTVNSGSINVPITLKYHPALIKPSIHPGWTGTGWSLESSGAITRTMNSYPDEFCSNFEGTVGSVNPYMPCDVADDPYPGSVKANGSNWNNPTTIKALFFYSALNPSAFQDVRADVFNFNFYGYSGSFIYSGPTIGWQVVSDHDIKVQIDGYVEEMEFMILAETYTHSPTMFRGDYSGQPRFIKGFTLTTPDGTRYSFGGMDAFEMESQYGRPGHASGFQINTWLIKRITDKDGNTVEFNYKRSYPNYQVAFSASTHEFAGSGGCRTPSDFAVNTFIDTTKFNGLFVWPVYLSKISTKVDTVEFLSSPATTIRVPEATLRHKATGAWLFDVLNDNINNLKWEQLNKIKVKTYKNEFHKEIRFFYSADTTQRLTLNDIQIFGSDTTASSQKYSFVYNNMKALPNYGGNRSDHWGYFNNKNAHAQTLANIYGLKQTDTTFSSKGLLTRMYYPTGGYTSFIWEPNEFGRVVNLSRNGLVDSLGYVGGNRIKEILNFDAQQILLTKKIYIYRKGYFKGANLNSLTSSGVLNGKPAYVFSFLNRPTVGGTANLSFETASYNSLTNYSGVGNGSHIGYDEVVELNSDSTYKISHFTSYGVDINGNSHFDRSSVAVGWSKGEDQYYPMNSLELERGKLVGEFNYTANNLLRNKTVYHYRTDSLRFSEFIKQMNFNSSYACSAYDALLFASANEVYKYYYAPVKKIETFYDENGQNPFIQQEEYQHNNFKLISKKSVLKNRFETIHTQYKYPFDFISDSILSQMSSLHQINTPVETTVLNNNAIVNKSVLEYYKPFPNIYALKGEKLQLANHPLEDKVIYTKYTRYGHVIEYSNKEDYKNVVIWGYNQLYPVAQISGISYNEIENLIDSSSLNNPASDAVLRNMFQNIRIAKPQASITTYTYKPLIGVTSITDPRGRTTFYEYDSFHRLKIVKDHNGNVVQTSDYKYKY